MRFLEEFFINNYDQIEKNPLMDKEFKVKISEFKFFDEKIYGYPLKGHDINFFRSGIYVDKIVTMKLKEIINESKKYKYKEKHTEYPIVTHIALNHLFELLPDSKKEIVDKFFLDGGDYNAPIWRDDLHYVQGLIPHSDWQERKMADVRGILCFYYPLIKTDPFYCEKIVNYINDYFGFDDSEKSMNYTFFAKNVYKVFSKEDRFLHLSANYGLMAFNLKDAWYSNRENNCLDWFWTSLCNILRILNRHDEAIQIAQFAFENDAFDMGTNSGWEGRLKRLKKHKNVFYKHKQTLL